MKRIIYSALGTVIFVATVALAQNEQLVDQADHTDRVSVERQYANYPELPLSKLSDAVTFRVEKGELGVLTCLPPTVGPARVKISDLAGLCTVNIHMPGEQKPPAAYTPEFFDFEHWDFSRPGITINTTVQVTGWNVQVSRVIESATDLQEVSLVQTPADPTEHVGIHLRVNIQKTAGDVAPVHIDRTAPNLVALRRLYPADTAAYLDPIFRDLHAGDAIFGEDHKLAWQVFAADARIDAKVNAEIATIIPRLNADDFHERERATNDLQKLGEPAAVCLWRMDRSKLSPEQNSRLDVFLSSYHPVSDAEARRLAMDVNFLLNCLEDRDDFIVNSALSRLRQITGREIRFDATQSGQARHDAIAKLRESIVVETLK